jgi:lysozyme
MRSINMDGLGLIERSEGMRLAAYQDGKGVWTIGYGHTHDVQKGDVCTVAQAEQWLGEDIASAENAVEHLVAVPLTDNQFAALVSFAFNVGYGAFSNSTLLTRLNGGNYTAVPALLKAWVFVGGKVEKGQITRRAAEGTLWSEA